MPSAQFAEPVLARVRFVAQLFILIIDGLQDGSGVSGESNRTCLFLYRTADCLPKPPSCIGAEFEAAAVVELFCSPHESGIAFLNQVERTEATSAVSPGNRDDKPQVTAGQQRF